MAQVKVSINGRDYQIACDDGQEEHLSQLGQYVDKRVKELVSAVGQVGDSRLLVMVSLLIADELAETYAGLKKAQSAAPAAADPAANGAATAELEQRLAEMVDAAAARIEELTARIGQG